MYIILNLSSVITLIYINDKTIYFKIKNIEQRNEMEQTKDSQSFKKYFK